MAESSTVPSGSLSRYFCHKCDRDIDPLPDMQCPHCNCGFVEEVALSADVSNSENDDSDVDPSGGFSDFLNGVYGQLVSSGVAEGAGPSWSSSGRGVRQGGSRGRGRFVQPGIVTSSSGAGTVPFDPSNTLEGIFQHILSNVATGVMGPPNGPPLSGANIAGGGTVTGGLEMPLPFFQVLHGNPGDYAWGSGGLDTVITQLLNNLDGSTGPSPMTEENIQKIPHVEVSPEEVRKNVQCSVCMEDFKCRELVRKLPCQHLYHTECIVPWLKMHATCPICRKILTNPPSSANGDIPPSSSSNPPSSGPGNSSSGPGNSSSSSYLDLNEYD